MAPSDEVLVTMVSPNSSAQAEWDGSRSATVVDVTPESPTWSWAMRVTGPVSAIDKQLLKGSIFRFDDKHQRIRKSPKEQPGAPSVAAAAWDVVDVGVKAGPLSGSRRRYAGKNVAGHLGMRTCSRRPPWAISGGMSWK